MVSVNLGFKFVQGDLTISLQEMIDGIFPKLLPLLVTLGMFKLVRKGKSPVLMIFGIMIISILLVLAGVLVQ